MSEQEQVLHFWFEQTEPKQWFVKSDAFDDQLREALGPLYAQARDGAFDSWATTGKGAVALCILLDQAPRNLFRNDAQAFATDSKALGIAKQAIDAGLEQDLSDDEKLFLYLPLEHSEDLADQQRAVALTKPLANPTYHEYAIKHREVIEQFGRFPHRNAALGRTNTADEEAYLAKPGAGF